MGGKIVEILSKKEREEFNNVIENSLTLPPDNASELWQSNENQNITGEVIPLNNYKMENRDCRDFKKVIKNNEVFEENSSACRNKRGKLGNYLILNILIKTGNKIRLVINVFDNEINNKRPIEDVPLCEEKNKVLNEKIVVKPLK